MHKILGIDHVVGLSTYLARRAEIDAYFAQAQRATPQLWNGRVLLGRDPVFTGSHLAAGYFDPYVGGGTKDFAPYVLMILVLMIRPEGIFGRRRIERV